MSTNPNNAKIHPHFGVQLATWWPTLLERFYGALERVSAELEQNVYHAPNNVKMHVSNFIGNVKQSDCIARGDTEVFNRFYNEMELALRPLKYIENHHHEQ